MDLDLYHSGWVHRKHQCLVFLVSLSHLLSALCQEQDLCSVAQGKGTGPTFEGFIKNCMCTFKATERPVWVISLLASPCLLQRAVSCFHLLLFCNILRLQICLYLLFYRLSAGTLSMTSGHSICFFICHCLLRLTFCWGTLPHRSCSWSSPCQ